MSIPVGSILEKSTHLAASTIKPPQSSNVIQGIFALTKNLITYGLSGAAQIRQGYIGSIIGTAVVVSVLHRYVYNCNHSNAIDKLDKETNKELKKIAASDQDFTQRESLISDINTDTINKLKNQADNTKEIAAIKNEKKTNGSRS